MGLGKSSIGLGVGEIYGELYPNSIKMVPTPIIFHLKLHGEYLLHLVH